MILTFHDALQHEIKFTRLFALGSSQIGQRFNCLVFNCILICWDWSGVMADCVLLTLLVSTLELSKMDFGSKTCWVIHFTKTYLSHFHIKLLFHKGTSKENNISLSLMSKPQHWVVSPKSSIEAIPWGKVRLLRWSCAILFSKSHVCCFVPYSRKCVEVRCNPSAASGCVVQFFFLFFFCKLSNLLKIVKLLLRCFHVIKASCFVIVIYPSFFLSTCSVNCVEI